MSTQPRLPGTTDAPRPDGPPPRFRYVARIGHLTGLYGHTCVVLCRGGGRGKRGGPTSPRNALVRFDCNGRELVVPARCLRRVKP